MLWLSLLAGHPLRLLLSVPFEQAGREVMLLRELTREEKAAIRSLVTKWCANYDREMGCLPLDCECYMLGKCWTGAYCRYFLEAALNTEGPAPEIRPCPVCGRPIPIDGRRRYCSAACGAAVLRLQKRSYMRKKRGWGVEN